MSTAQLNKELNLTYPDSFVELTQEDLKKHKFFEEAPGFCIQDAERHIMISVSWRQANPFVAMLAGSADIYKVQDIGMMGESLSVKSGSNFYYIHSYLRQELREESLSVLDGIFETAAWEE